LSQEESEEVQIKGRTARQGKNGSYEMLLLTSDLEAQFGTAKNQHQRIDRPHRYDWLNGVRKAARLQACKVTEDNLAEATSRDCLTHAYFDALLSQNTAAAALRFQEVYQAIKGSKGQCFQKSRMICLSDATGSMEAIWSSTMEYIHEMLRRIEEIGGDNLELMWIAYKDYDVGARSVLQKSPWSSDPAELRDFIAKIECTGGGDYEEAVEVALREVNIEHAKEEVTRVLVIADAPPYYEQTGQRLDHHDHVLTTDYKREARTLAANDIPVYTFYLQEEKRLISAFKHIAEVTGGEAAYLDSPAKLIDVVCQNALEDIGGHQLVAEYNAKYR